MGGRWPVVLSVGLHSVWVPRVTNPQLLIGYTGGNSRGVVTRALGGYRGPLMATLRTLAVLVLICLTAACTTSTVPKSKPNPTPTPTLSASQAKARCDRLAQRGITPC